MKYLLILSTFLFSSCSMFGGAKPDQAVQDHCKATYHDQSNCEDDSACEWFQRSDQTYVCRAKR